MGEVDERFYADCLRGQGPFCKKCRCRYAEHEGDDEFGTGLCYECFEEGVEGADIKRRERIARENEY